MSTRTSTVSWILLTLLLLNLSLMHGKDIGDKCTIDSPEGSSAGVCKILKNCPSVYDALLAGHTPKMSCGFMGFEPIVCCPTGNDITKVTTSKPTTSTESTNTPIPWISDGSRGSLARAICADNAKAVYGLETPPTLLLDRTPVNTSRCAQTSRKLIVGGKKAEPKEFPHMTAIGYDAGASGIVWKCGGSLISKRIVLTAAHCTYTIDWGIAKWARIGDLNLLQTNDSTQPQTIKIIERITHPNYKRPSAYHDIAVLKLETSVDYTAWVRPACLPIDMPDIGRDGKAIATGWGRVDWAEETGSDNLLKVTINLISQASCNESFYDGDSPQLALGIVDDWQICAGELGKDTCQGDSGGPLAVFSTVHDCMYNVIGVTSVGRLCGSIVPGVYTRVYHYIPWIERTAWPEYFQQN
ncbi:PREDICTED: serine protease persephone-like [Dinoponera quadriceps]|uniref:Serine protease persephone-like n=1 Tax=Dinoponera quadriceps TaxID=609295 RepID=A0A6P3YBW0_DINQU|nr:PREDICTED: serine protease persephone-like [Dinoponera quadriceps]